MISSKTTRVRASAAQGFRDVAGPELNLRTDMVSNILETYRRWGFAPLETPAIERAACLGAELPDQDRPNAGVFAWENQEDLTDLALRYDLTAPLARYVAENRNELSLPFRRASAGPVWRNEKVAPGRFRQFWQCDADIIGAASIGADAELCCMLGEGLASAGLEPGDAIIRISNRKLLDGLLEAAGVSELDEDRRMIAIRAIDKLDRLGPDGVRALLGEGRQDKSGAFTRGANLGSEQIDLVLAFLSSSLDDLPSMMGASQIGQDGLEEIDAILNLVTAMGIPFNLQFDPSIIRGLGYYTGAVFEADITFEVPDRKGRPRRFGSVAGGGRYDSLLRRFTGQDVPAVGASIGVDRLAAALISRRGEVVARRDARPILITVVDRDEMAAYQNIASTLRGAGLNAQVYYGKPGKLGPQLKYADQIGACLAIIQGRPERDKSSVLIKDLDQGRAIAGSTSAEEWARQPQQVDVPRASLLEAVLRLLGSL